MFEVTKSMNVFWESSMDASFCLINPSESRTGFSCSKPECSELEV